MKIYFGPKIGQEQGVRGGGRKRVLKHGLFLGARVRLSGGGMSNKVDRCPKTARTKGKTFVYKLKSE